MKNPFQAEIIFEGNSIPGNLARVENFDDSGVGGVIRETEFDFYPYGSPVLKSGDVVGIGSENFEVVYVDPGIPEFTKIRLRKKWSL